MSADINSILVGYRGKIDMLKACFGSSDEDDKPEAPKQLDFKSFTKAHNTMIKSQKKPQGRR